MEVDKYTALPAEAANFVSNGGFEHPVAYAAGSLFAAGAGAIVLRYKHMREQVETEGFTDPNMDAFVQRPARRERIGKFAAGLAAFVAFSSLAADTAEPYTEESYNLIDDMAVVVDTSDSMYALDVVDGDEEVDSDEHTKRTKRIDAAVNSINRLNDLAGVDVTFIAAGDEAEQMGTIGDRSGRLELVENFESYTDIGKNRSGSDKAGALRIADAIEADKVLMFTGSVEDVTSTLGDESNADRVSVIATGTAGTMVDVIGSEQREAELDHAGIEEAVGADNAYQASSVEEVQAIVDGIVREHYVETEREDFDGFETVRNLSLNALAAGVAAYAIKGAVLPYVRRRNRVNQ